MKAIVLAGGKGTRLLPLTADVPKPLVMLGSKPVLFHIFDLLKDNGFDEIVVTLKYLGEKIETKIKEYETDMRITCMYETEFLGTAGSVKNALGNEREDFLVISGDAYCEFDLKSAYDFHKRNNSKATIITKRVDDPREYGLVLSDKSGRIERFIEKPSWTQAITNCANTGVYVLSPEALREIPADREYDFSFDLFPSMLKNGLDLFSYEENGYWCDVGDIEPYLDCNRYVLSKMSKCETVPRGDFSIENCVYIGKNVKISDGVKIGKYTYIGNNVTIGKNAEIYSSVIYDNSLISQNCIVDSSVVCSGTKIGDGCRLYPFSCIGNNTELGNKTTVAGNVRVAENIKVCSNSKLDRSVRSSVETDLISCVPSGFIPEADSFFALELGLAVGSVFSGQKIAVATDGEARSVALMNAFISGAGECGAQVWDFGEAFSFQMCFFTSFCSLPLGVFFKTNGNKVNITLTSEGGLPLLRNVERNIVSRLKRKDYSECESEKIRRSADMSGIGPIYSRVLLRQSDGSLSKMKIRIDTENEKILLLMEDTVKRLEGEIGEGITVHISADGGTLSVTENNKEYAQDDILSVLCFYEAKNGRDIALKYFSPQIFDKIAHIYSRSVLSYYSSCADSSDKTAREAAKTQLWTRDALFMAVKLLSLIHEEGRSLDDLSRDIPDFHVSVSQVEVDFLPSELRSIFSENENADYSAEGVSFSENGSRAIILPEAAGNRLKILAESFSLEAAEDLCSQIIKKINDFSSSESV